MPGMMLSRYQQIRIPIQVYYAFVIHPVQYIVVPYGETLVTWAVYCDNTAWIKMCTLASG
jgi:hypothetical protein